MKRVTRQHRNRDVRRERDSRALRRQIVLLACGLTAACGFVLAVGQHYAAVRYGYEGEQLREERKKLIAENKRLLMELNAEESPAVLEQRARAIGMQPARPSQMGTARRTDEDAAEQSSRDASDGHAGDAPTGDERAGTRDARGPAKRGEKKLSASDRVATRERVAAQGAGDSRPRVVGQSAAKDR